MAILEFTKQHRHYLKGRKFLVRTDHAPLQSVLKKKDPEGQLARWIAFLSTLDFNITYREGIRHTNADALSRRPCTDRCKWCQAWKNTERPTRHEIAVQTEDARERNESPNKEGPNIRVEATHHTQLGPPYSFPNKCSTVKLAPV